MIPAEAAELLDRSGERDRYEQRIASAWREGVAHGEALHADDYERGFAEGIVAVKEIEHDLVRMLRELVPASRWSVRGQRRTRQTYAGTHPRDYPGGPLPLERTGGEAA